MSDLALPIDYLAQHEKAGTLAAEARKRHEEKLKAAGEERERAKRLADLAVAQRYEAVRTALERARVIRPRTAEVERDIAELDAALRGDWPKPDYSAAAEAHSKAVREADRELTTTLADIRARRDRAEL